MKLIIAGSRHLQVSNELIESFFDRFGLSPTEIVSGGAKGIDTCAQLYCRDTKGVLFCSKPIGAGMVKWLARLEIYLWLSMQMHSF